MRKPLQLAGLAACLVAGILLATALVGNGQAADSTTTETTTETTSEPTTVLTTTTVEQTTTRPIIVPSTTTSTSTSDSSSETPAWVWVLVALLAVALAVAIVLLARRGGRAVSPAERRGRLDGAVASWTAQGWALESQGADSAVLQRAGERLIVTVDPAGRVSTRPYSAGTPA